MKYSEIESMQVKEIIKKTNQLRKDLFEMKMKNSMGQLSNPLQVRFLKKDIARLLTAQRAKKQ